MNLLVENLHKTYDKKAVVDGISFEITSGETIGILGPNGAGKTTLFYMIAGLVAIDSGKIYLSEKGIEFCNNLFNSQKNRILNAFKKSSPDEVLYFKNVLKRIIE